MEAVRKRRLRAAKASISYGETRDKILHEKAEQVKQLLTGTKDPQQCTLELQMAELYYKMLDEYYHKQSIRMPHTPNKRSLALWRRVATSCRQAQAEPEAYLRAQFSYFHKAFGKPPEVYQLATENAVTRAQTFEGNSKRKVIGNDIRHKGDFASIMRQGEQQMQQLCRAHDLTRAEVYRRFVLTGLFTFPKQYLEADPVYKQVQCETTDDA